MAMLTHAYTHLIQTSSIAYKIQEKVNVFKIPGVYGDFIISN